MSDRSSRQIPTLASVALALALAACGEAKDPQRPAGAGGPGQILYLTYCQSCHGIGGRGDGLAAASLRKPPTDLTRLSERYGTPLDRERVAEYVDGRTLLSTHGAREMPIWGDAFFEDSPAGTPELVERSRERLITVLVEYLETLQAERKL